MKNIPEDNEREFFRNRFDDFESEPDESVWKKVQTDLFQPASGSVSVNRLWLVFSGLVVAALVLGWWFSESGATATITHNAGNSILQTAKNPVVNQPVAGRQNPSRVRDDSFAERPEMVSQMRVAENSTNTEAKTSSFSESEYDGTGKAAADKMVSENTSIASGIKSVAASLAKETATKSKPATVVGFSKITREARIESDSQRQSKSRLHSQNNLVVVGSLSQPEADRVLATHRHVIISNTYTDSGLSESVVHTLPINQSGNGIFSPLKSRSFLMEENRLLTKSLDFRPVKIIPEIQPHRPKSPRQLSVYASFTHWMNYYAVAPVVTDTVLVDQVQLGNTLASQRSGWQWQAGVMYPISKRLSLRAGVFYYQQKRRITYQAQSLTPASSIVENLNSGEVRITHTYATESRSIESLQQKLGLRLDGLYQLGNFASFRHYVSGGLQGSLVRMNENKTYLNTDVQIGYGLARPLSHRLSFWLEPVFRYSLNNRLDPAGLTRIRPYSFGMQAGLSYQLR